MQIPQAKTIDEVIALLDDVIARTKREHSRLGYFPALYRKVTIQVKAGIRNGLFEDNPRMEQLDVSFANRYIEAIHQYWNGQQPTQAWRLAFDAGKPGGVLPTAGAPRVAVRIRQPGEFN